jgi:DNA-binding response OmpR family regulator
VSGKRVLVVDDDEDLVRILSLNLLTEGFEVSTAFDGMSAVMRTHKDHPDLIILDLKMPAGDGFSVLEKIKCSTKTFAIPVVILSALPKEDMAEKAIKAGAIDYFSKPFDLEALISFIKKTLGVDREHMPTSTSM